MLKYVDTRVCFAEIPDEITLCINLSNCPCHCKGCHSSYLAEDIGEILTYSKIEKLLKENKGVTAICFMGGDNDPKLVNHYAKLIKESYIQQVEATYKINEVINLPKGITLNPGANIIFMKPIPNPIKVGWYSGRQELSQEINVANFDFIKLGPYQEEHGPLSNPNTNQRFYQVENKELVDITHKFWEHETENQSKENKQEPASP